MDIKMDELNAVAGGAVAAVQGKYVLVCTHCHHSEAPKSAQPNLLAGELLECPVCHQVTMQLRRQ